MPEPIHPPNSHEAPVDDRCIPLLRYLAETDFETEDDSGASRPMSDPLSLDPLSLDPLSLDPLSLDPLSLDPLSLDPALAEHLTGCERCQQRLLDSAAPSCWREAVAEHLAEPEPDESSLLPAVTPRTDPTGRTGEEVDWGKALPSGLLDPPSHPELLGRLGRYEIERLIGQGGMGLVFRAFDPQLHRVVAVKLLAPQLAASVTARERFAREARAVAALTHPHVVAIHDVVAEGPLPYLVMTYIDGVSLEERVARRGPLSIDHAIQLARQLTSALATAHEAGLIHRDIKPGNILCEADGQRAVLTDFGLVRTLDDAMVTRSGVLAGTPHFMAPEQAKGSAVGPHSDLWGVGAVLYFALTGRPPFDAEHPMAVLHQVCSVHPEPIERLRPEVPKELARIICRLLQKRPANRYRDCESLKHDLDRLAAGGHRRWSARVMESSRRRWAAAIAASVALVLVGLFWAFGPGPEAGFVRSADSSGTTAGSRQDAMTAPEWFAFRQADREWWQQFSELDAATRIRSAANESSIRDGPPAENRILGFLDQLERFDADTRSTMRPRADPRDVFDDEVRSTLELLDSLATDSPFAAP